MKAVLLAGGKGTRLYPYTTVFPKPLVPIDDLPIIEVLLRQLKHHGVTEINVSVGHLAELIIAFLGKGEKLGLNIQYTREDEPLGTVGALSLMDDLPENFFLMNGDVLTDLNFSELLKFHMDQRAVLTVATYQKKVPIDLGVLVTDSSRKIVDYIEKPTKYYDVSMGVYVLNRSAVSHIPKNKYFDFPSLVKVLIERGEKVVSFPFDGIWLDIGRPSDYDEAQLIFKNNRKRILNET